jgi:hypothetical protein
MKAKLKPHVIDAQVLKDVLKLTLKNEEFLKLPSKKQVELIFFACESGHNVEKLIILATPEL